MTIWRTQVYQATRIFKTRIECAPNEVNASNTKSFQDSQNTKKKT